MLKRIISLKEFNSTVDFQKEKKYFKGNNNKMRFVGQGQELLNIFNSRSRHTVLYICVTNILLIPGFTDKSDLVHLGQGRTAAQQINRGQRRWPHSRSR